MGWMQRRRERVIAQRAKYCVGSLNPGEKAFDVQSSMFDGPRGWAEGDLLLTSERTVFRTRKGPTNWTTTMPHELVSKVDEVGRSRISAGITRVYVVQLRYDDGVVLEFRIDTSPSFMANWMSVLALGE